MASRADTGAFAARVWYSKHVGLTCWYLNNCQKLIRLNPRQDTVSMSFPAISTMGLNLLQPMDETNYGQFQFHQNFVKKEWLLPKSHEATSSHLHLQVFSFSKLTLPSLFTNSWLFSVIKISKWKHPPWVIPFGWLHPDKSWQDLQPGFIYICNIL